MAVLVAGDTNSNIRHVSEKRFCLVLHIYSTVHLLHAQCSAMSYWIYLAFSLWLIFICVLPWPTSLPCFLCCCDSYFPSWGSIKSYLVLSYLIYLRTAGNTRQTLMEPKKIQDDLRAFFFFHFVQRLLKGFYQNKDEWFHLACAQTDPKHHPGHVGSQRLMSESNSFVGWVVYFISISCCYKFIIHPSWGLLTHSSYAPTTQSPWQPGSQA